MFERIRIRYSGLSVQAKTAFWFVVCGFITKAITFISVPIFSRILQPTQYGIVVVFNAYQQILIIFATLELSYGAYAKSLVKYDNKRNITFHLILLSNLTTIISLCLFIIFQCVFTTHTTINVSIYVLAYAMFLVHPAYNCWITSKRFNYEYKKIVIVTFISSLLLVLVPTLAILRYKATAEVKIATTLITSIMIYIPFYIMYMWKGNKGKYIEIIDYWKFCLKFQLPLVLHSLSFLALSQADRIMINNMINSSDAAVYSVAYTVGSMTIVFQNSISQAFQPFRYTCLKEGKYYDISKSTNRLLILVGTVILLFSLIGPEIMSIMFSDEYRAGTSLIPVISESAFFMFMYSTFVDIESYYEETKYVMCASLLCAILNILLNYLAIPQYGFVACAYTTLFSYIIFSILHFFFAQKVCVKHGINANVFDTKIMVLISIISIMFIVGSTLLYNHVVIRYLIVITMTIIIVVKKREIKELIERSRG